MTTRLSNTKKTLLALALSAALIFTLIPQTAFADSDDDDDYKVSNVTSLAAPTGLIAQEQDEDEIDLSWSPVKGAGGYEVYRYSSAHSKWILVEKEDDNTAEIDDLSSALVYSFKVRAFAETDKGTVYSDYSPIIKAATLPDDVDDIKVTAKTSSTVTLKWKAVKRADKYQVYKYDSATGKYERIITTSKTSYKVKGLKGGKTYKFKVRPYREALDTKFYGDFESIKVKTKASSSSSGSSSEYISAAKAKSIALKKAGVSSSDANFTKVEKDSDDGVKVYEIEFTAGDYEYEVEINAKSGKIMNYEKDDRD